MSLDRDARQREFAKIERRDQRAGQAEDRARSSHSSDTRGFHPTLATPPATPVIR